MTAGKPKKSEVLEVRLPYQTKTAFMARCRDTDRTASEVVRIFIDQELDGRATRPRAHGLVWRAPWGRLLAAALAGLAVGAVAAPSLARPTTPSHAAFERLDANHDGNLSFEEFSGR
jgi:hypothetical protein